jgi:hypothetical protein
MDTDPHRVPISFDRYRSFLQFLLDTRSHAGLIADGQLRVGTRLACLAASRIGATQ